MEKIITPNTKYGMFIPGLKIDGKDAPYGVVNDRSVRAGAGLMFALGSIGFFHALYTGDFLILQILVLTFLVDFTLKVFKGPHLSPFSLIGDLIVKKQSPEYVGAIQKRFAWSIGFIIALIMTFVVVIGNITGIIPLAFCLICLLFMWFESSFGICIGCKMYWGMISLGLVKEPEVAPACPGGACPINKGKSS